MTTSNKTDNTRHPIPDPSYEGTLEDLQQLYRTKCNGLPGWLNRVHERPSNLSLFASEAQGIVTLGSVFAPQSPEVSLGLKCVAQGYAAMFEVARTVERPVTIKAMGREISVTGNIDESSVNAGNWLKATYCAMILEDVEIIDALCQFSTNSLRQSTTRGPEHLYLWVDALKAYFLSQPEFGDLLVATMRATDPEREDIRKEDVDWVLKIRVPTIQLFQLAISNEPERFNETLAKAVGWHKSYWTQKTVRRLDWNGYVSLELSAMVVLAKLYGTACTVQSDYLLQLQ